MAHSFLLFNLPIIMRFYLPTIMAFCTNCGAHLADGAKFCGQCGSPNPSVNNQQPGQSSYQQPSQQPAQQPYQTMQGGYQQSVQPVYQQPMQQPGAKFVPPTYPEGTPVLTFIWEGSRGSFEAVQNWGAKKVGKKTEVSKIQIFVNGVPIAPDGALDWFDSFRIEVPITSADIHIEIRTKSWFCKRMEYNFRIDPRYSYDIVLTEPSILASSYIMGLKVVDKVGVVHYSLGNAPAANQWLSFLVPFIGFYFAFASPEAKESKVIQRQYLLAAITNIVIIAIILLSIFG